MSVFRVLRHRRPLGRTTAQRLVGVGLAGAAAVVLAVASGPAAAVAPSAASAAVGPVDATAAPKAAEPTKKITRAQLKTIARQVARELGKKGARTKVRTSAFTKTFQLAGTGKLEIQIKGNKNSKRTVPPMYAKGAQAFKAGQPATVQLVPTGDGKKKLTRNGKTYAYVFVKVGALETAAIRVTIP